MTTTTMAIRALPNVISTEPNYCTGRALVEAALLKLFLFDGQCLAFTGWHIELLLLKLNRTNHYRASALLPTAGAQSGRAG
jgi:hypothetical protein